MKGIYNLLSDAFAYARLDEREYIKNVQGNRIIITRPQTEGQAHLELIMVGRELIEFDDSNTLFTNSEWDLFCAIIAQQIPRVVQLQELMEQIYRVAETLDT